MSNATDVILRLLATSSDSNRGSRKRSSHHSSDEEISENEISDRSDVDEEEVEDDDEDDGPVDEYDDKMYGDAEDRARLLAMPEVEREQILFERIKRRQTLLDQRQIAKRLRKQEEASRSSKKGGASGRDSARRSTRAKDTKAGPTKALQDLKKAQERKKARRSYSPEPRRRRGSADYSDKSEESAVSSESEYESDRDSSSKKKSSSSKAKPKEPATLQDLNDIRLGRDKLEKWCFHPFFKDTVTGCFVRLLVGERGGRPVYRACEVIGVNKYHKLYTMGQTRTNVTLILRHGAAERPFTMDNLSNQPFTHDEFRRFEVQMTQDKLEMVDIDQVERKKKDIQHARDYVMTDKEIEDMIALKRAMNQGKLNPIVHRNILEQQKSTFQTEEEIEEAERQLQQLRQQEVAAKDRRSDQLDVWARLNERNRTINRTEGRQAEGRQATARKQRSAAGKDNFDPFARLRTIPKMVHEDADSANNSSVPGSPSANDSATGTPMASQTFSQGDTPTTMIISATPKMPQSHYEELIATHRDMFRIEVDLSAI
ncbi:RNA polymerase-associated protein rtf1 [Actinomortierella ambigua]|uniref:RNA polymerase-associated protein rtf1 n=1 Tax=Actinomortierella ambigua TaxID=1343610 RepID=A0A9P6Q5A3_9FUNG|nr:RNA polymerase-associated protein rtf1 [Actinomortierella ambigua]KAG0258922.1 RNA polymerase-associated protein rtf1 [Actinomortierella ambigua]